MILKDGNLFDNYTSHKCEVSQYISTDGNVGKPTIYILPVIRRDWNVTGNTNRAKQHKSIIWACFQTKPIFTLWCSKRYTYAILMSKKIQLRWHWNYVQPELCSYISDIHKMVVYLHKCSYVHGGNERLWNISK